MAETITHHDKKFYLEFHLREGFYFRRLENGDVNIFVTETPRHDSAILREIVIPENEWASVVASVSAKGENADTWQQARDFHSGG